MYPREAIEACEALSHPLPHPTMTIDHSTTDDRITAWLHQADGGSKVDTTHPGPIEMLDAPEPKAARIGWGLIALSAGVIAGLVLVAVAGPFIEHLPALMGATAK